MKDAREHYDGADGAREAEGDTRRGRKARAAASTGQ
jgi:hypothetical protein